MGAMLNRLRKQKRWNQTTLARAAGVDKGTISRVLKGVSSPYPETLERICTALGIEDQEVLDHIFVVYDLSTHDMQERALEWLQTWMAEAEQTG